MKTDSSDTRSRILKACWQLLEKYPGKEVSMGDVAKATGISRQAVYLHFKSRTDLMIATTHYVDEVKGLNEKLAKFNNAATGTEQLEYCVEIWGNYIPEIYSIAKALLRNRDSDEATAAAWNDIMACLYNICEQTIKSLNNEGILAKEWETPQIASEMLCSILSIQNWEQLTKEYGWTTDQYIDKITYTIKTIIIKN